MSERKVRFTVDLDVDLHDRLRRRAFDHNLPMTEVARRLIRQWLDEEISIEREEPSSPAAPTK